MAELGRRLKAAREEKGWTLEELAVRSGLKYHAIYSYERGTRVPRLMQAIQLAAALGVPVEVLAQGLVHRPGAPRNFIVSEKTQEEQPRLVKPVPVAS